MAGANNGAASTFRVRTRSSDLVFLHATITLQSALEKLLRCGSGSKYQTISKRHRTRRSTCARAQVDSNDDITTGGAGVINSLIPAAIGPVPHLAPDISSWWRAFITNAPKELIHSVALIAARKYRSYANLYANGSIRFSKP